MPKGKRKGKSGEYHTVRPWSGNRSVWPMSPRFASNTFYTFVTYGSYINDHMYLLDHVIRGCTIFITHVIMIYSNN